MPQLAAYQAKVARLQEELQRMQRLLRKRDAAVADLQQQAHELMQLDDQGLGAATSSSIGSEEGDLKGVEGPAVTEGCSHVTPAAPRPERIRADQQKRPQCIEKLLLDYRRHGFYRRAY